MAVVELMVAKTKVVVGDLIVGVMDVVMVVMGVAVVIVTKVVTEVIMEIVETKEEVALVMTATSMVVLLMIVLMSENVDGIVANAVQFLTRTRFGQVMSPIDRVTNNASPLFHDSCSASKCTCCPTMNCCTDNVIYLITCTTCNQKYVGETFRMICTRMVEHRSDIRIGILNSHLVQHFNNMVVVRSSVSKYWKN